MTQGYKNYNWNQVMNRKKKKRVKGLGRALPRRLEDR